MDSSLDFSDGVDDEDAAFLPDDFGLKTTGHNGAIDDDDDALFLPDIVGLENEFHHIETTPLGSVPVDYECIITEKNYEIKAITDHNTHLTSMLERAQHELRSLKEKSDLSAVARNTKNEEELDGSINEINKKRKIEDRQIDVQDRESIESNEFSIVASENIALRKSIEDLQNEVKAFVKERTYLDDYINDSIVSMRLDLENFESQMNPPSSSTDFAQIWADCNSPLNPSAKPDSTCSIAKIEALKSMHKSIMIVTGSVVDRESQEIDRLKNEINNISMEYNHKLELIENYQKENLELKTNMNQVWIHAQSETERLQREREEKMRELFFELRSKVEQVLHEKEVIVAEYNRLSEGVQQLRGERDNAMNVAHTAIADRNELIEVMNKLEKEKENAVQHAESTVAEKLRSFALKSKNGAAFEEMHLRQEIAVISGELEDYQERCYDLHAKLQEKSNDLILCERQKLELSETLATLKKQSEEMFESLQHQLQAETALKTAIDHEFQAKASATQLELDQLQRSFGQASTDCQTLQQQLLATKKDLDECLVEKQCIVEHSREDVDDLKIKIRGLQLQLSLKEEEENKLVAKFKMSESALLLLNAEKTEILLKLENSENFRDEIIQESALIKDELSLKDFLLGSMRLDLKETKDEVEHLEILLLRSSSDFDRIQRLLIDTSMGWHECQLQSYANMKRNRNEQKQSENQIELLERQLSKEQNQHQQVVSEKKHYMEELEMENSEILLELLESEKGRKSAFSENRTTRKHLALQKLQLETVLFEYNNMHEELNCLKAAYVHSSHSLNRMSSLLSIHSNYIQECQLEKYGIIKKCLHESQNSKENISVLQIENVSKQDTICHYKYVVYTLLKRDAKGSETSQRLLECEADRNEAIHKSTLSAERLAQNNQVLEKIQIDYQESQEELEYMKGLALRNSSDFHRLQLLMSAQSLNYHNCQLQKYESTKQSSDKNSILLGIETEKSDTTQRLHNAEAVLKKTLKEKNVAVENLEKLKCLFDMVLTDCKERQEEVEDLMDMQLKTSSSFTRFQKLFTAQSTNLHNYQLQKYECLQTIICHDTNQQRKISIQDQSHLSEETRHEVKSMTMLFDGLQALPLECHQTRESSPFEENQSLKQHARSFLDYEACSDSILQNRDPTFGLESLNVTMEIEFVADEESCEEEELVSIQERCHDLTDQYDSAQVEYTKLKDDYNIQNNDFINLRKAFEINSKDSEASQLKNNELVKQHSKQTLMFKHDLNLLQLKYDWDDEEWRRKHHKLQEQLDKALYELRNVNDLYVTKCSDFSQLEIRYEVKSKDLEMSQLQKLDLLKQMNEQTLVYQHDLELLKLKIRWDSELSIQKNDLHGPGQTLATDMNKLHEADTTCNSSLKEIERLRTLCSKHLESLSELQQQRAILELDLETCQLQKYDLIQQHKSESLRWKEELRQLQIRKVHDETNMKNENSVMLKQVETDCNFRLECMTKERIAAIVSIEKAMTELANQCESTIIENQFKLDKLQAEADEYAQHKARASELEIEYSNSIKTWMEKYQHVNRELEIMLEKENKLKREHEEAINMAIQEVESLETENSKLVLEVEQKNYEIEKFKDDTMRRDLPVANENSELLMESKRDPLASLDSMPANDENAFHDPSDVQKMPAKFEIAVSRAPLCNLPNGQNVERFELLSPMTAEFMSPLGVTVGGLKKKYTPLTDDTSRAKYQPMPGERSSTKKHLALSLQRSQISISSSGRAATAKTRPLSVPVASKLKDPRLNTRLPGPTKPTRSVLSTVSPKQSVLMTKKSRLAASPSQIKSKPAVRVSNIPQKTAIPRCSRIGLGLNQAKG